MTSEKTPATVTEIELPVIKMPEQRCVGCQFTIEDFDASPALRTLLESEGCASDCPIVTGKNHE